MADGEDVEYDSDPEDVLRPSMMRRREASDDEDGEGSGVEKESKHVRNERLGIRSDDELEGEGGAPGYDEEEYEEQEEDEMLEEEVEEEDMEGEDEVGILERNVLKGGHSRDAGEFEGPAVLIEESGLRSGGEMGGYREKNQAEEQEKKENEPYAVPTAGAFYMHDDRFEENGRGRHRRMPGGRRLWESKDDQAWVHDRFEEMNLQDWRYEERRMRRGRFRGRGTGRGRGAGRGYGRGSTPRAYHDDNRNQNRTLKSVRGRGPIRYEPLSNSREISSNSPRQHRKTQEQTSNNSTAKKFPQISDAPPEPVAPRKQAFASSLSSASPPFYPSGSSNQDISAIQKRDLQTESNNKPLSSTVQMENLLSAQPASLFRGKPIIDSVGFDRLHLDDSVHQVSGKALVHAQAQASGSSISLSNANKSPPYKVQGRNSTPSIPNHLTSFNQVARIPSQNQPSIVHQKPVQSQGQTSQRISTQLVGQHLVIANQVISSHQASVSISSEGEEAESSADHSKSNSTLVGKGKNVNHGAGRGSFFYGGAQVIGPTGTVGLPHGDPNFAGTPALLPVMQFGGQHPGGIRVPAVGMALPGYVAQPGFGNSEMTWVPVLAGAAGTLGTNYCSPYIALDGTYYARPSGQASTSVSSSMLTTPADEPQNDAVLWLGGST
ncbi:uncharacterized protein LOC110029991 isoform X2 [Phalaenopsis equestris]|uniref:uncharacterized protein LOC110029991 isoform X2 n=1 Tax=Phalaenopsis equestris TaxID=78828 RepID=UPI0009E3D43F|nr:uncharacterized protein LOC110029991 isoform X2 [Phalaenopsis equestris]XP_020588175.1 uncharacterized protein LOC110029991 isoform X2 [Phalaenopsis equestris]XP_020588176.1 uncharacterized protein LOC110029991 isoform X2 [Phalaenopsis equestris]